MMQSKLLSLLFVALFGLGVLYHDHAYAASPVATAFSTSTNEDTTLTVDLTPYASDADGNALTFYKYTVYKGTISVTTAGIATFTPTANYYGTAAYFTFYVKDSTGASSSKVKVSITVNAVNDAPVAKAVSASPSEDVAKSISFSATDADSTALTYAIVTSPSHGTLGSVSGSTVSYTSATNYNGTDSFSYKVTDDQGEVSNTATVSLTVVAVNDAPTTTAFSKTTNEDEVTTLDLTPYAADIDGDTLSFYKYIEYKGTVAIDATTGIATFTPTANYYGSAAYFSFYAKDPGGKSSSKSKVSFTITAVNDAPVASDVSSSVNEDSSANATLSATDVESAALTYQIVSQPAHGSVSLATKTATYKPEANFNGPDTFTYKAYETSTTSSISNTATVTVTVAAVNDAPTAEDVTASTNQGSAVTLALSAADIDGDTLTYSFSTPTGGTVSESGGVYTYTPTTSYSGSDTFTYTVSDGALTDSANITVTVIAKNETPVASGTTATTDEDTAVAITLTATDAEGTTLTYAVATSPTSGTVTLSDNTATYTPTENFNSSDSFTFTASDGTNTSDAATVTVTVAAVNDPPVAVDVSGAAAENTATTVTLVATDDDDDKLSYQYLYSDHGDVTIDGETLTFTPNTGFGGSAIISYRASDGKAGSNTATVTIAVTDSTNDTPTAKDLSTTLNEDHAQTITFSASDPEGAALTYAIATSPTHGSITVSDDEAEYTPDADFYGSDTFSYTASDGSNTSNTATVTLTVTALPDPVIDCAMTIDPSHEQTDTTSGLTYWDSLVEVVMDTPATTAQLTELITTAGGTGNVCKIELTAMSEDEKAHVVSGADTSDTDFAEYRIEIAAQTSLDDVASIATNLKTLSYVTYARPAYIDSNPIVAPETDTEQLAYNSELAMHQYFGPIHLEGALEYLAAYRKQIRPLKSISLAMGDTGVCASQTYIDWCYSPPDGITAEFTHFKNGENLYGELDTTINSLPADLPLGLVDPDYGTTESGHVTDGLHGTDVAALMASESNGSSGPNHNGIFENEVWSGIVGSVAGLNYKVTSYMVVGWDEYYHWKSFKDTDHMTLYYYYTCGDDVVNSSFIRSYYGPWKETLAAGEAASQKHLARQTLSRLCDTLYVWGAGNDDLDMGSDTKYKDYMYYTEGTNNIGVQGTQPGSINHEKYTVSTGYGTNYGSGVSIATSGGWTSFAAPLVSGAAGLLKAVDPSLSPSGLVELLQAGKKTSDTSTAFLDIATSVLMAIHSHNADYVPMTLTYAIYKAKEDLATLRVTDGYSGGTHDETGSWRIDNGNTLVIQRDSTEESDAPPGPDADTSDTYYDWAMQSHLISTERLKLGLGTTTDATDSRTIPALIAQPQDSEHTLSGKFHAYHYENPNATIPYMIQEDHAQSYCFKSTYTANASGTISDGGYQVPLAMDSKSSGFTVPYNITGAHLSGNVVKNVYDYWDPASFNYYLKDDSSDNKDATDYAGMEIPDCNEDVTAALTDNTAEFDSWKSSLENTVSGYYYTYECDTTSSWYDSYNNRVCNTADSSPPYGCKCTQANPSYCGFVNNLNSSSPYAPDENDAYLHVEADISDVECNLTLNAYTTDEAASADVKVDSLGDYVQVFWLEIDDASSPTCQATANFTVTSVFERSYESNDYEAECMQGSMLRTGKETQTFSATVTWDFKQGKFPLLDAVEKIQDQLPTLMQTYTSWIYEDEDWSYPIYAYPAGIYGYSDVNGTTPSPFSYIGRGEDLILPATLTHGGQITPGFGTGMESMFWSHGLGPIKHSNSATKEWELDEIKKLDRSIP